MRSRRAKDADLSPLFRGLPNDHCQCLHWGTILKGRLKYSYEDGSEDVIEAGDAYYARPGRLPMLFAGTEVVEFSPTDELAKTVEVADVDNPLLHAAIADRASARARATWTPFPVPAGRSALITRFRDAHAGAEADPDAKEAAMDARDRRRGLSLVIAGIGIMVFAVILVGLTTASGGVDWVSIATAAAGLVMVVTGLFVAFRHEGPTARST